jgi:cytochrome c553
VENRVSQGSKVRPGPVTKLIGLLLAGAVALVVGAIAFAWSGVGDIAASQGHYLFVERFLEFGMRNAVARHAKGIEAPANLDDPNLIRLGAAHFHRGCAFCHGAPGIPVNPIARHMLPAPPDLAVSMRPWNEGELFWIVKHGFKYTGMPGWVAIEREDEIWAVVAFLRRLSEIDAERYKDLALGKVLLSPQRGAELATMESNPRAASACARCHGAEGQAPMSALVPVLHGQSADYLLSALDAYAHGKRRSGIMQPLAADLRAEDMRELASFYAGLAPPAIEIGSLDSALVERGRKLASEGLPAGNIAPCAACHDNPAVPRLAGQHAAYLAGQLQLWKKGQRLAHGTAAMMEPIAQNLSDADIEAVAAYYAQLKPTAPNTQQQ